MVESQDPKADKIWPIVLEKIKEKYSGYGLKKRKYQPIPFNSTPEHYELLVDSFKEELSFLLEKSESEVASMIPSPGLFAEMYRIGKMPKGKKLNACYLYATGKSKTAFEQENKALETPLLKATAQSKSSFSFTNRLKTRLVIVAAFVILASLSVYLAGNHLGFTAHPSGLVIERPSNGKIVPMILIVEGKVSNADLVWIVVRDIKEDVYYVQRPIKVKDNGTWSGPIHIGGDNKLHIGKRVQIRAFVNPIKDFLLEDILYIWPKAELSSNTIDAVRGSETK